MVMISAVNSLIDEKENFLAMNAKNADNCATETIIMGCHLKRSVPLP